MFVHSPYIYVCSHKDIYKRVNLTLVLTLTPPFPLSNEYCCWGGGLYGAALTLPVLLSDAVLRLLLVLPLELPDMCRYLWGGATICSHKITKILIGTFLCQLPCQQAKKTRSLYNFWSPELSISCDTSSSREFCCSITMPDSTKLKIMSHLESWNWEIQYPAYSPDLAPLKLPYNPTKRSVVSKVDNVTLQW